MSVLKREGMKKARHLFDRCAVPPLTTARMEQFMEVVFEGEADSNLRRKEEAIARSWLYFLCATECKYLYFLINHVQ